MWNMLGFRQHSHVGFRLKMSLDPAWNGDIRNSYVNFAERRASRTECSIEEWRQTLESNLRKV
jgi:hypothetical protein